MLDRPSMQPTKDTKHQSSITSETLSAAFRVELMSMMTDIYLPPDEAIEGRFNESRYRKSEIIVVANKRTFDMSIGRKHVKPSDLFLTRATLLFGDKPNHVCLPSNSRGFVSNCENARYLRQLVRDIECASSNVRDSNSSAKWRRCASSSLNYDIISKSYTHLGSNPRETRFLS